jgi:protein-L-isoaspartate(D-aspartate) O-methyltransferase
MPANADMLDSPMIDFAAARRMMVDGQVRTSDVTDPRIIAAMLAIPRERFVPNRKADLAYLDLDLAVTHGVPARHLLKPMVLAKMIQAADIHETDSVLDVGGATGYSAAVLSRLAATVTALETDPALAEQAKANVHEFGAGNVSVATGDLPAGWRSAAPYDVILVNGSAEEPPKELLRQLKDGGRLVVVLGSGPAAKAMLYRASGADVSGLPIFDANAPLLPGFAKAPAFVF